MRLAEAGFPEGASLPSAERGACPGVRPREGCLLLGRFREEGSRDFRMSFREVKVAGSRAQDEAAEWVERPD